MHFLLRASSFGEVDFSPSIEIIATTTIKQSHAAVYLRRMWSGDIHSVTIFEAIYAVLIVHIGSKHHVNNASITRTRIRESRMGRKCVNLRIYIRCLAPAFTMPMNAPPSRFLLLPIASLGFSRDTHRL